MEAVIIIIITYVVKYRELLFCYSILKCLVAKRTGMLDWYIPFPFIKKLEVQDLLFLSSLAYLKNKFIQ